jgi:hypothetical protein
MCRGMCRGVGPCPTGIVAVCQGLVARVSETCLLSPVKSPKLVKHCFCEPGCRWLPDLCHMCDKLCGISFLMIGSS